MVDEALVPSIGLIGQIFDRFGGRPSTASDGFLRWPLTGCRGAMCIHRPEGESKRFDIQVTDVGLTGIGFVTEERIESGMRLIIELILPGLPEQKWPCRAVRVLLAEQGQYRVGAAFETWPQNRWKQVLPT